MRQPEGLHYVEKGNRGNPVILFMHGITGSRRYWEKKVRRLADRYYLVIPDMIGFGLSPKPHVEYTLELFRESVRRLIEHLQLAERPIIMVGHSLGALVALEYAARYGDHIDRMVLLSLPRFTDCFRRVRCRRRGRWASRVSMIVGS